MVYMTGTKLRCADSGTAAAMQSLLNICACDNAIRYSPAMVDTPMCAAAGIIQGVLGDMQKITIHIMPLKG